MNKRIESSPTLFGFIPDYEGTYTVTKVTSSTTFEIDCSFPTKQSQEKV